MKTVANSPVQEKTVIAVLSYISLAFVFTSFLLYLYYIRRAPKFNLYLLKYLLQMCIHLAPHILFPIYLAFCKKEKNAIMFPILCFSIVVSSLLSTLPWLSDIYLLSPRSYFMRNALFVIETVIYTAFIVSFVLLGINALYGLKNKRIAVVATVIGAICQIMAVIDSYQSSSADFSLTLWFQHIFAQAFSALYGSEKVSYIMGRLGVFTLYASLFWFALNNRIPPIIHRSVQKESVDKIRIKIEKASPKRALAILNEKLDFGDITEDEYQILREEIIKRL